MKIRGIAYASKQTVVFWCFAGFYLSTISLTAHGLSTMEHFNGLAAGGDEASYLDGDYNMARFQIP